MMLKCFVVSLTLSCFFDLISDVFLFFQLLTPSSIKPKDIASDIGVYMFAGSGTRRERERDAKVTSPYAL